MAAKFNKDMLVKNRFWVILSVTVVLAIFGLVYLQSVNADEEKKDALSELEKLKALKDPQGETSIKAAGEIAEKAKGVESKVWSDAYAEQEPGFTWSDEIERKYTFSTGKFANEITVAKVGEREAWPEDAAGALYGILEKVAEDYLTIKARNKKDPKILEDVTIFRTKNAKITGPDDKSLYWEIGRASCRERV